MSSLRWLVADFTTGNVLDDLPTFEADYPLKKTLSQPETVTGKLWYQGAPPDWEDLTTPGTGWLVCYDSDHADLPIQWVGYIQLRDRQDGDGYATLTLASGEAYLDRVYPLDILFPKGTTRGAIAAFLINTYVEPHSPINLLNAPPRDALTLDEQLVWQRTDNQSVLSRLTEIIGLLGGEFTVDWVWSNDATSGSAIYGTFRLDQADYLGLHGPIAADVDPPTVFDYPGTISRLGLTEDYSNGKGASYLIPYSPNDQTFTQYGDAVIYAGHPRLGRFELIYTPGNNLSPAQIADYAKKGIAIVGPGACTLTVELSTASLDGRRYGIDYKLGDTIRAVGQGLDYLDRPIQGFPDGFDKRGRLISISWSETSVALTFADEKLYVMPTDSSLQAPDPGA